MRQLLELIEATRRLKGARESSDLNQVNDARNRLVDVIAATRRELETVVDPDDKLPFRTRLSDAMNEAAEAEVVLLKSGKFVP